MPPQRFRILLADDHVAICKGVRSLLECREHWQIVAEAANGHDALRLARETQPDVAILDYALPSMNGLELTRILTHELPHTKILIYTMYEKDGIAAAVLRAGARGYVLKSDPTHHLITGVETVVLGKPYFSPTIAETVLNYFVEHDHGDKDAHVLTSREREVVQLIAEGNINRQVADLLDISIKTVETHRAAAMEKLKLRTTAELVRYAVRNDIVQP